jgi:hypothetical protein
MPNRLFSVVVAICASVVTACGGGGTSYVPCAVDGDCKDGEICIDNRCQSSTGCTQDSDCKNGRVCLEGVCRTAECNSDGDCGANQHCENHKCVDNPPCVTDNDCLPTEYCDAGTCKIRQQKTCTQDNECAANELCLDQVCTAKATCTQDDQCPSGTVCSKGQCNRPCASDTDCGNLYKCVDRHCLQQCISDSTCMQANTICEGGVCVPAQCQSASDCTGQNVRCLDGRCQTYTPCTTTEDCQDPNFECRDNICEELPLCLIDGDCARGSLCVDGHCRPAHSCQQESDCAADQDCVGGVCVAHLCRGPADCPPDQICVGGTCSAGGNPATVYSVVILTPGGPIQSGRSLQLAAVALTQAGEEVPGIAFEWTSSQPARAAVDENGLLTGGSEAGDTQVTAKAAGTQRVSAPVTFSNILPVTDVLRVTVIDAVDRRPLEGVKVIASEGANTRTAETDSSGQASFPAPGGPVDVHAFSQDHDYVTIGKTISRDVLVPLPPRSVADRAGGFTGQMSFTGTGEVSLGLAGTSIAGHLMDLNFSRLMGQVFTVRINLGTQTISLPLPAQMVMKAEYNGIPISIKDTYYVLGQEGLRAAWGLGGKMGLAALMQIFNSGSSIDQILIDLLPYFAMFHHAIKPQIDVFPVPLVTDANDIDGDGDSTESRPDWASFPTLNLDASHPQSLSVEVVPPALPSHGTTPLRTVIFMAGGLTPQGFTPLGMSGEEAQNGQAAPMVMKLAPAYGGLEVGRYALLAMASPPSNGQEFSSDMAAVSFMADDLPTRVEFEKGFLPFPTDASWAAASRTVTAGAVAGAALYRFSIAGPDGSWIAYLPADGILSATLPEPPSGYTDLAAGTTRSLMPIALTGTMTFEDLIGFDGEDLDRINAFAVAFSTFELP